MGNTVTFNALATGGTQPYTYKFNVYNSITNSILNSITISTNSYVFLANANLVGNTINANVYVTDADGNTVNSILVGPYTINSALSITIAGTPSPPAGIDAGNTITFNALVSGGTQSYTYTFKIYNSITNAIINTINTGAANSYTFTTNANLIGNTVSANVFVTDGESITANSAPAGPYTINTPVSVTSLVGTPSPPTGIEVGNTVTFNALAVGGTQPYTYKFNVYNSITNSILNSITISTNSYVFLANANLVGNTINANVYVTDADGNTVNSILVGPYTINSALSITIAGTPSPPAGIDAGNTITFNALVSGGTPSYTYTFKIYNSITNAIINTINTGAANSYTFTTNANLIGNTVSANVFVTDGESITANSAPAGPYTINTPVSVTSLVGTPSAPTGIEVGNTITFNALAVGGTQPYTYKFNVYNSITNSILNSITISTNSYVFLANANLVGNTINANVYVTDADGNTVNSILVGPYTINSALSITIAGTPSPPAGIDAGNTITFNALVSGGTPSYTYTFKIYNSITNAIINSITITSNNYVFLTNAILIGNTLNANVYATDGDGNTVNSVLVGPFTILSTPIITLANAIAPNSIDILAGYPSDNALITASCSTGDNMPDLVRRGKPCIRYHIQ